MKRKRVRSATRGDRGLFTRTRPSKDEYYMGVALAVRERANCRGRKIGAVLMLHNRVISSGYNGTPEGMMNCEDGGCERCLKRKSGKGYDVCICVHAEQNALVSAAKFGIPVSGASLYTTLQPCFGCFKELIQAGVSDIYFLEPWTYPQKNLQRQYADLIKRIQTTRLHRIILKDPRARWAAGKIERQAPETGHMFIS